jgi:hypothetical protein
MESPHDRTASLMTPAKLAQAGAPRAPVSPAAWLDQMASDAGHMHVSRLAELRRDIESQVQALGLDALVSSVDTLADALPGLDFGLLQPQGWWARTTGRHRSAAAEFVRQADAIDAAAAALVAQVQAVQKQPPAQAGALDRSLLEMEVEYRAIDKIIDQGARWLQDMRAQIKARMAQGGDPASQQQARDDAARCEILVVRLKALRAAAAGAQQALDAVRAAAVRRAAVLSGLHKLAGSDVKAWRTRIATVSASAGDDKATNLEGPVELHRELQDSLRHAMAQSTYLRTDEAARTQALAALGQQLAALG